MRNPFSLKINEENYFVDPPELGKSYQNKSETLELFPNLSC